MLTGTPLDLTPFGGVLAALGWLYWLLALAIVLVALWWPRRWWLKLVSAAVVAGAVVYPIFVRPVEKRIDAAQLEQQQAKARLDAALAHFEMRCKSAGEKITRTVDNVDGVVWMKWREPRDVNDDYDQFKLFDPYGRDCAAEECVQQLLRLDGTGGRFVREVELRKGRYKFVESVDPGDGKHYRYTLTMALPPNWTTEAISDFRKNRGTDPPDFSYQPKLIRQPIERFSARYGITWDDISTPEDREHWIAGGSIRVIDLQTNEVVAERVGFMMDQGLGSRAGFRTPWLMAQQNACPQFAQIGEFEARRRRGAENLRFAQRVLQPAK